MRFTVKAKLASAFGAVIILSMITGGVAYVKLNQLAATSADLVAGRAAATRRPRFRPRSSTRRGPRRT